MERHDVSTGLFTWGRQLTASKPTRFLLVQLTTNTESDVSTPCPVTSSPPGSSEIELRNGARVRAGHGADLKSLRAVLAALDGY